MFHDVAKVWASDGPDPATESTELEVVEAARNGDRAAFALLVKRYQNVVAALAYALTGQVSLSEDVAQETFLVAWRRLGEFREAGRFRAWLLGIARRCSLRAVRDQGKKVLGAPRPDLAEFPSLDPSPLERVISHEEEKFVWHALRRIPETYRVPLVLFYREEKSLERVAELLDLSPTNVSVRLVRGRRMLQKHVMAAVETTLVKLRLDKRFSAAVLAALAALPASAPGEARAGARTASTGRPLTAKAAIALLAATAVVSVARRPWVSASARRRAEAVGAVPRASGGDAGGRRVPLAHLLPAPTSLSAASATNVVRFIAFEETNGRFPFEYGKLADCPQGMEGPCVVGTTNPPALGRGRFPWAITPDHPLHLKRSPGLFVSFDYWLGDDDTGVSMQFDLRIDDVDGNCCWQHNLRHPVHRTWGHATIPISRFVKYLKTGEVVRMGDFEEINLISLDQVGPGNRGFYLANLQFGEDSGPAM